MYRNLALSDNGFLFDSRTGNTFSLNGTGTFLLKELIGGTSPDDLVDRLIDRFDVANSEAGRDVEQFLFRLKELHVAGEEEEELLNPLTIAVTGLSATDNPAPGVPVARGIREEQGSRCRIVGLSYDPLEPGNYMDGVADSVFLVPFPSSGADVVLDRLREIQQKCPIDVLIPNLDAELPLFLKIENDLREMGIHTFLPTADQLKLRSKARFSELKTELDINVPRSIAISDSRAIERLDDEFKFPVMVKGQFYDAAIAYSPMEVASHFQSLKSKWGVPIVIQEFVTGEEYDVVALGDGEGELVSAVPMRKMQLTDKGKAWGGITIDDAHLIDFVRQTVKKLKWRGPCELEVMRSRDGKNLYLLEINPRFPAWVYLAVAAGRNLPWLTVQLALGKPVSPLDVPEPGIMFLRHSFDQICKLSDYEALAVAGELLRHK